jgi:hypothetical protein
VTFAQTIDARALQRGGGWPMREGERDIRFERPAALALYELVTSSLKAADTLASAWPRQGRD